MEVTIIKKIFLHDVELDLPRNPTQEQINKAIEDYINNDDLEWDDTDYIGYERVKAYDNYSGVEIYDSMNKFDK